jgi:hypothetical protein
VSTFAQSHAVELSAVHSGSKLVSLVGLSLVEFAHRLVFIVVTIIWWGAVAGVAKFPAVFPKLFMGLKFVVLRLKSFDEILPLG